MPTQDGYPTIDEIRKVVQWDGINDPFGLVDFLREIWHWQEWGLEKKNGRTEIGRKPCLRVYLHTGGWSGNETIIDALQENFFWTIFWVNSHRGGHFEFEIPLDWLKGGKKDGHRSKGETVPKSVKGAG